MIYHLVNWLFDGYFARGGLVVRMILAAGTSFALVLATAPGMIRFLVKRKVGDRPEFDHAHLNELTRHKSMTPTMGGVMIVIAIFASVMLFADLGNFYIRAGLFALVWLGALGGWDDWLKLNRTEDQGTRGGLPSWIKLLWQVALAVLLSVFIYRYGRESYVGDVNPAHSFYLPFRSPAIALPLIAYAIITILTMVGSSNAVNLTDGMDGLAAGGLVIVSGVFLVVSWIEGVSDWALLFNMPPVAGSAEMTILCSAMLGSCLGFLWFNAPPAQVFMGDTGSLPLGGLLGFIAVVTRQELMLLIAGGVFVMEAGSVILQVSYYKMTKPPGGIEGRRLFRCAPLHHHFHLGGWPETKVVARFWILALIFAALALATLKLR